MVSKFFAFGLALCLCGAPAAWAVEPCGFMPAESRFSDLSLQGHFQWFDDAFRDDRDNTLNGAFNGRYRQLFESAGFGYRLDGDGTLRLNAPHWDAQLGAAGTLKRYLEGDAFLIGALDAQAAASRDGRLNLTGGAGVGRFRDVTPLSKAIRIQNRLLDRGVLLGPLVDAALLQMARTIADPALSREDQLAQLAATLEAEGVLAGNGLGARALLEIEALIATQEEARLCGWEAKLSVGGNVALPDLALREAVAAEVNVAAAPDPASQWSLSAHWDSGLNMSERYALQLQSAYGRRLGPDTRLRLNYTFQHRRAPDAGDSDAHRLSGQLLFQWNARLSLNLTATWAVASGDETPVREISLLIEYDLL